MYNYPPPSQSGYPPPGAPPPGYSPYPEAYGGAPPGNPNPYPYDPAPTATYPPQAPGYSASPYPPTSAPYPSGPYPPSSGPYPPSSGPYPPSSGPLPPAPAPAPYSPYPPQSGYPQAGYPPAPMSAPYPPRSQSMYVQPAPAPAPIYHSQSMYIAPAPAPAVMMPGRPAMVVQPVTPMPAMGSMVLGMAMGGINANFTVQSDADRLYYAMVGLGTDELELIEIVGSRPRQHLNAVAMAYRQRHGHDLVHDLKGDTSFFFKDLLVGLVKPYDEYLADCVHEAISGIGTKNRELVDIICQTTPQELQMMKAVSSTFLYLLTNQMYARKYHHDVVHSVKDDTSFNFKKLLTHVLTGNRMPPCVVDAARVEMDSKQLYRAGEGRLGTNDTLLIDIISQRSAEHLQAVSQAYARQHHGHTIEHAIRSETSGDYQFALLALVTPRPIYVAQRIHDAVFGLGNKVPTTFVTISRILQLAAVEYRRMFGHDMECDVRSDTSGDYKRLLNRLLRP